MTATPNPKTNKQPPLPKDPVGAKFCQLFNHLWHFILAPVGLQGAKVKNWYTEKRYPLQPRNLWQMYLDPGKLVGLRFGPATRYLVIDLDIHSPYHPKRSFKKYKGILHALEKIGLCRYIVVQSSYSEGIHIFVILPEQAPTFGLACAVRDALEEAGYYLRDGQLEIFPNVKAYRKKGISDYKGIRLPLQPGTGSYILDDDLCPISDSISDFLAMADWVAEGQDMSTLNEAIAVAKTRQKKRYNYSVEYSPKVANWEAHLKERIETGWTGYHQTNDLLKDIGTHGRVFKGLGGEKLVDYIYQTVNAAPGYRKWCRHQHEIKLRCRDWAHSTEDYYYPLGTYSSRRESYAQMWSKTAVESKNLVNEQRQLEALERIKLAVEYVQKQLGALPKLIKERVAAIIAAAKELTGKALSRNTLYKREYLPFWHPQAAETTEVPQDEVRSETREADPNIVQTDIQAKSSPDSNSSPIPHPPSCSTQNEGEAEKPETSQGGQSGFRPTPPPLYEGCFAVTFRPSVSPSRRVSWATKF